MNFLRAAEIELLRQHASRMRSWARQTMSPDLCEDMLQSAKEAIEKADELEAAWREEAREDVGQGPGMKRGIDID